MDAGCGWTRHRIFHRKDAKHVFPVAGRRGQKCSDSGAGGNRLRRPAAGDRHNAVHDLGVVAGDGVAAPRPVVGAAIPEGLTRLVGREHAGANRFGSGIACVGANSPPDRPTGRRAGWDGTTGCGPCGATRLRRTTCSSAQFRDDRTRPTEAVERVPVSLGTLLPLVWGCGTGLMLMPLAVGLLAGRRWSRRHPVVSDGAVWDAVVAIAAELGIKAPVVHLGPPGAMPMVWGMFRGHLLLPREAATCGGFPLRAVLLHELAHLRRRDPLTMLIGQWARAVYWFNPLAWWRCRGCGSNGSGRATTKCWDAA